MKKIAVASNNKHKIEEIRAMLAEIYGGALEVNRLSEIGFSGDIIEDGETFEENAAIKARAAAALGYIAIADDSGLCVDALNGAPGVYSARFAGEPCDDRKNNDKLLELLSDVPESGRGAKFVSVICCVTPDGQTVTARGECPGRILFSRRGTGGFGYDPLFFCELGKTFAELTPAEKNSISHRARAMANFAEAVKKTKIFD